MEQKQVLLGMSGGVDSSAAAVLLMESGYAVSGCTLRLCEKEPAISGVSFLTEDVTNALAVAQRLGLPFYTDERTGDFRDQVMAQFVSAYCMGETPNPCVECNRTVKFPALLEKAESLGISHIATGHYARVRFCGESGRWQLLRGADESKDQSYFLYPLTQHILSRLVLPLGEYTKPEIRAVAARAGLVTANRRDSQDICFVPDGDYVSFLQRFGSVKLQPGKFVDGEGRVLGEHRGLVCYTKGQRKGLGVSGGRPLYVVAKNAEENTVVLGDDAALYSAGLVAARFNWVSVAPPAGEIRVLARIRHSRAAAPAVACVLPDGSVRVRFDAPQRAVTAGQSVVLYEGDLVLGGGVIAGSE